MTSTNPDILENNESESLRGTEDIGHPEQRQNHPYANPPTLDFPQYQPHEQEPGEHILPDQVDPEERLDVIPAPSFAEEDQAYQSEVDEPPMYEAVEAASGQGEELQVDEQHQEEPLLPAEDQEQEVLDPSVSRHDNHIKADNNININVDRDYPMNAVAVDAEQPIEVKTPTVADTMAEVPTLNIRGVKILKIKFLYNL